MADSKNRRPLTTQQLRALDKTQGSAGSKGRVDRGAMPRTADGRTPVKNAEASKNAPNSEKNTTGKKRRGTKKQARRTVAGLLLATALVVCAIPVSETKANTPFTSGSDAEWVKVLNYTSYINAPEVYENANGRSDIYWQSTVPLVDSSKYTVYTTSTKNNTVQYRFCFVPVEPGSSQYVAVILGVDSTKINNNTLTIDSKVSAFKKYSWNTSTTNYCAVSMDDSYLYYLRPTQRMDGNVGYYKVVNNEYIPKNKDSTHGDIPEGYIYTRTEGNKPDGTTLPSSEGEEFSGFTYTDERFIKDNSVDPAAYSLKVDITTYVGEKYEDSTDSTNPIKYRWKEKVDSKTYTLEKSMIDSMNPCFDSTEDIWGSLEDSDLWYFSRASGTLDLTKLDDFTKVGSTAEKLRIHDVDVAYIGQQSISDADNDGVWEIDSNITEADPTKGVFAGLTNVTTVNLPETLLGIGDCAFYGGNIKAVNFNDSGRIATIGNSAFANCRSLETVYIPTYSQIKAIGRNAFYEDYALSGFTVPTSIHAIGDYAFAQCKGLQYIDFSNAIYLDAIGYHAFEGCERLNEIEFHENFCQNSPGLPNNSGSESYSIINSIPIDTFKGCYNLKRIAINHKDLDIVDGYNFASFESDPNNHAKRANRPTEDCDIDYFLDSLIDKDEFYFEGEANSNWKIYDTAKEHCISYKHRGEDIYERVVECNETPTAHNNTFTVNGNGEILSMEPDSNCTEIVFPRRIGKIGIRTIRSTLFNNKNKCNIKKVIIPSSIELIESGAFAGCHQLEAVLFVTPEDPNENPNLVIEDGAFATQNVTTHHSACTKTTLDNTPYLSFVGTVSDSMAPFNYAMNPNNNINNGQQTAQTYITFFSGWPTNLTVKYEPKTGKNTLIDVPKYSELKDLEHKEIVIKKWDGSQYVEESKHKLPYLTQDNLTAAQTAVSHYELDIANPNDPKTTTGDEQAIIDSALNILLPKGIQAIQTGLFSNLNSDGSVFDKNIKPDYMLNSLTMYSVEEIEPYAFAGINNPDLATQAISSGLKGIVQAADGCFKIGDYAFRNCKSLVSANLAASITDIGLRPFMGCDLLTGVDFNGGSNFSCSNQIIYGMEDGLNTHIVECLECRGGTAGNALVGPSELEDVKSMSDEAFMDCDGVGQVDLSQSELSKVSERAFALTDNLGSVKLPENYCKSIGRGAFWSSNLYYIEVPDSVTLVQPEAFANVETTDRYNGIITKTGSSAGSDIYFAEGDTKNQFVKYKPSGEPEYKNDDEHKIITAYCVEDSAMDVYSEDYEYINPEYYKPSIFYTVYFWDTYRSTTNPELISTQEVAAGDSAIPPEFPEHDGVVATGWSPNYQNIVRPTDVVTIYSDTRHEVWFTATDPNTGEIILNTEHQFIEDGKSAVPPAVNPSVDGYIFKGWKPDYRNIYHDGAIVAWFAAAGEQDKHTVSFFNHDGSLYLKFEVPDGGELKTIPTGPARDGYKFTGWAPNNFTNITKDIAAVGIYEKVYPNPSGQPGPSGSKSPSPSPGSGNNGSNNPSVKTYTCTVSGGSGTGTYIAGQVVPINAYDMGEGQVFDRWTTSTGGVAFGSATNATTFFTMPANNVAITATFKPGSGRSSGGGNSSNNNTGNRGNTGTSDNPSGTAVQVTKGGFSNTGVAGATVSGSTDNFIVKVTEDQTAADVALTALQNKFGDITTIKYLPMDISLYDSTGRTKIADTSGMSVSLTLPLPDDLATYAGNNKIASVAGGVVEDLNSRFTTVDGVPCISFTATHFSPYVIYVDTANLTESTIDYTPKTGDPIHPKWFLAIGLACVAVVLFFKKDKVVVKKAHA